MKTKIKIDDIEFLARMVFYKYIKDILTSRIEDEVKKCSTEQELVSLFKKDFTEDLKPFEFQNLKDQIDTYKLTNTPFDTNYHKIDDFLVEVYRTMCDMSELVHSIDETIDEMSDDFGDDEMSEYFSFMKKGSKRIYQHYTKMKVVFNHIMLYHEFTEVEIRGIQYNYLKDMLKESIENEDFEDSALIRDKISSF